MCLEYDYITSVFALYCLVEILHLILRNFSCNAFVLAVILVFWVQSQRINLQLLLCNMYCNVVSDSHNRGNISWAYIFNLLIPLKRKGPKFIQIIFCQVRSEIRKEYIGLYIIVENFPISWITIKLYNIYF